MAPEEPNLSDVSTRPMSRRSMLIAGSLLGIGALAGPTFTTAHAAGPTVWPNGTTSKPTVTDGFRCRESEGGRCTRFHYGTDFIGFGAVRAVSAGVVRGAGVLAGWSAGGTQVHIAHDDGYQSRSLHLVAGSTTVSQGQRVTAGQVIGTMGNSGASYGVHLHLEIHAPGAVDPEPFLATRVNGTPPPTPIPTPMEQEMKVIRHPDGSLAVISAFYAGAYAWSDPIGYTANSKAWGVVDVSAEEYFRLISDANARRAALIQELSAAG